MAHTTWIEKCEVKVEGKEIKIRKKMLGGKKNKKWTPFPDSTKPKSKISGWKIREGSIMRIKVKNIWWNSVELTGVN